MNRIHAPWAALCLSLALAGTPAFAGDPIPGIDITVNQAPGGRLTASGVTDPSGTVTFANLSAGAYTISIDDPSQLPAPAELEVSLPEGSPTKAFVQRGAAAAAVNRTTNGSLQPAVATLADGSALVVTVPARPATRALSAEPRLGAATERRPPAARAPGTGAAAPGQVTVTLRIDDGPRQIPESNLQRKETTE